MLQITHQIENVLSEPVALSDGGCGTTEININTHQALPLANRFQKDPVFSRLVATLAGYISHEAYRAQDLHEAVTFAIDIHEQTSRAV